MYKFNENDWSLKGIDLISEWWLFGAGNAEEMLQPHEAENMPYFHKPENK